jgi:hypothetical protein
MMGVVHWTEFYRKFQPFCAMARQYGFFNKEVDEMEQAFWDSCPLPHSYKPDKRKKKVKTNVSNF